MVAAVDAVDASLQEPGDEGFRRAIHQLTIAVYNLKHTSGSGSQTELPGQAIPDPRTPSSDAAPEIHLQFNFTRFMGSFAKGEMREADHWWGRLLAVAESEQYVEVVQAMERFRTAVDESDAAALKRATKRLTSAVSHPHAATRAEQFLAALENLSIYEWVSIAQVPKTAKYETEAEVGLHLIDFFLSKSPESEAVGDLAWIRDNVEGVVLRLFPTLKAVRIDTDSQIPAGEYREVRAEAVRRVIAAASAVVIREHLSPQAFAGLFPPVCRFHNRRERQC